MIREFGTACVVARVPQRYRAALALLLAMAGPLAGCAQLGYQRIRLGQEQPAYRHALPEDKTRRTPTGLCYLEHDPLGGTEAVVVLLTRDRRVAGKLHARQRERELGWQRVNEYRLHGELHLELLGLPGTGPIDTLRSVAADLAATEPDSYVREAHGWVVAGLVRLVQRWPPAGELGLSYPHLFDTLERVPAGGVARLTVERDGVLVIEYEQSVTR